MLTAEEIGKLVEERLHPHPKGPTQEQLAKLAAVLSSMGRTEVFKSSPPRFPTAFIRPSALHRRPRQNRYKYALNDAQERTRRKAQAHRAAIKAGRLAFAMRVDVDDNPFNGETRGAEARAWTAGWVLAASEKAATDQQLRKILEFGVQPAVSLRCDW